MVTFGGIIGSYDNNHSLKCHAVCINGMRIMYYKSFQDTPKWDIWMHSLNSSTLHCTTVYYTRMILYITEDQNTVVIQDLKISIKFIIDIYKYNRIEEGQANVMPRIVL